MSSVPSTAEGAGTVISSSGAYNGGTAVMTVREIGTDSYADLASARPEQMERYRTVVDGRTTPLE